MLLKLTGLSRLKKTQLCETIQILHKLALIFACFIEQIALCGLGSVKIIKKAVCWLGCISRRRQSNHLTRWASNHFVVPSNSQRKTICSTYVVRLACRPIWGEKARFGFFEFRVEIGFELANEDTISFDWSCVCPIWCWFL